MSLSNSVLLIAFCSFAVNSSLVIAAEEAQEPTSKQILEHP